MTHITRSPSKPVRLKLLSHRPNRGVLYDETVHAANRDRALPPLTKAA